MKSLIQKGQEIFFWLVGWKEKTLRKFFLRPWVAPMFYYITPNDLCYLRIVAAIAILVLYKQGSLSWLFPIFVAAVLLDLIDGPLARSTNQITEEGKKLDPIADKVLISIPLLAVGMNRLGGQTISMFLLVEGLLILTAYFLKPYLRGRFFIPLTSGANIFGQIKMNIQAVAIGVILYNPESQILLNVGEVLIWIGIGFGIGSFLRHLARMDEPVEPRKRIITVPNVITLSGLFLFIPAGFALAREQWWTAGIIISWLFISDWLDGWYARRYNQVTAFGAVIDPLRDYLARFIVVGWFFYRIDIAMAQVVIMAMVVVEAMTGLVNISTAKRCRSVSLVTWWGKVRGTAQYLLLAVPFFHCVRLYTLQDYVLIGVFFVMFIFSLIALISYVDQRRRLISKL